MDSDALDDLGLSVLYKHLEAVDLPLVPSLLTKTEDEIASFKFDWLKSDAVIKKAFAMDVLIGFAVEANIFNRSENVMYIGVPGQRCPLPSPFKKIEDKKTEGENPSFEELRKLTNAKIISFVLSTIYKNVTSEEPKEETIQLATEVLLNMTYNIDELVANFTEYSDELHTENIKEFEVKLNKMLINNINKEYPQIWQKYLGYIFEGVNVNLDFDKDLFYLGDADSNYLPKILSYVLTTSDIYLELYMWWVTVFAMIINTSSDVVEYILKQTAPFYTGTAVLRSR